MTTDNFDAAGTIDLAAFPIDDTGAPGRAELVARCRDDLARQQYCVLADFITPAALAGMVAEVEEILPDAYRNRSHRNCYLQQQGDPALPADHPRNLFFTAGYRMIAADLFPAGSRLTGLYRWPATRRFIADIVGSDTLYPSEDPYQPVNVLCYGPGDESAWHFDSSNAFTVTLMLQAAEAGGDFEIAANVRSEAAEDLAAMGDVLTGGRRHVVAVPRTPGALVVFRGCHSLHRVTPVAGNRPRLMAVFVYETEPGVIGDPEVNATVYGPRTLG